MIARFLVIVALTVASCSAASAPDRPTFPIEGFAHAGPTCPVEREPPDPACADRPVPGADVIFVDAAAREIARIRTDDEGRFQVDLPAGDYTVVPQPVEGLLGTAQEQAITVPGAAQLDVAYDTGIR